MPRALRSIAFAAFAAAAANAALLALLGGYDLRIGPLHLAATYLFKPLLYLNAAFLLVLAVRPSPAGQPSSRTGFQSRLFYPAAFALAAALYAVSFRINLDFPDWNHRAFTAGRTLASFLTQPQPDGYYRPLTFASLWLDQRIFGAQLWGYHLQNFALYFLNAILLARLACRLGMETAWARRAALMFLALPAAFEAVVWPGARFDLFAAAFTLLALDQALAGRIVWSTAAFALGVLSKESAYCYPLLLGALWLLHGRLDLTADRARLRRAFAAAVPVALVLIGIRYAVYSSFGGFSDAATGGTVHFTLTLKTITSMFTRLPAALYLVNTSAGTPAWLRIALLGYVVALSLAVFGGAALGRRRALIGFAFLAAVPTLNMIGWVNQTAQQGRYLYQPGIWIVLAVCWALASAPRGAVLAAILTACMGAAALTNTLAYLRMHEAAQSAAIEAAARCRESSCCRAILLDEVPRDLYGGFYFREEVRRRTGDLLPGVAVFSTASADGPCVLRLRWTAQGRWDR